MESKVIEIPTAQLGMKPKLKLSPSLKEIAEAYLYRQLQAKDLRDRVFKN